MLGQVSSFDRPALQDEGVIVVHQEVGLDRSQRDGLKRVARLVIEDEHDVGAHVLEPLGNATEVLDHQPHPCGKPLGAQGAQGFHNRRQRKQAIEDDLQERLVARVDLSTDLLEALGLSQDPARFVEDTKTLGGQMRAMSCSVEEREPERVLQRADLVAHSGGGARHLPGGGGEAAQPVDGLQGGELVERDVHGQLD